MVQRPLLAQHPPARGPPTARPDLHRPATPDRHRPRPGSAAADLAAQLRACSAEFAAYWGDHEIGLAQAGPRALAILTAAAAGADAEGPLGEVELRHVAAPPSATSGAGTSCPGEILLHATGAGPDPDTRRTVETALGRVLAASRAADTGRSAPAFRDGRDAASDALPAEVCARLAAIRHQLDPAGRVTVSRPLY